MGRKKGQVKLRDVRPTFDLSLSLVLESPSLDLTEEANHSVEPATIRGKGRIDARINEDKEDLQKRGDAKRTARARQERYYRAMENVAISRPARKLRLRAVVCFETTRVS